MKIQKKMLAAVLALLLVLALSFTAAGCKKKDKEAKSSKGTSSSAASGTEDVESDSSDESGTEAPGDEESTADAGSTAGGSSKKTGGSGGTTSGTVQVVNNCYTSGTKIAKDTVTLKVMIRDHSSGLAKYNDSAFAKYVLDTFNIKLEFEAVDIGSVGEKISLAYASNTLPDMFWGMAGGETIHYPYIDGGGLVTELSQYYNKYGPNIKKMFKEAPETQYVTTYDDGKTYMLPMYRDQDNYSWKYFINKTWLSNLGLVLPTTTDKLYDVLSAFKTRDANKNGSLTDEIPLVIASGEAHIGQIPLSLFSPFGLLSYTNGFSINQSTGKVQYSGITEEYRNGLRYYRKLYADGLLYENFRGATNKQIKEWTSGSVQTVGMFSAMSYSECVSDDSFVKNYTLLPPLTDNASRAGNWVNTTFENVWADWFVLMQKCKYPEIAVRLVDWLYTTEGTIIALNGPPGKNAIWNYDSKGKLVWQPKNIPSGKTQTEFVSSQTPGYPIPHYLSAEYKKLTSAAQSSTQTTAAKAYNAQLDTMYSKLKSTSFPHLHLTYKETSSINAGNYSSHYIQSQWNFIGGTASLENDWDNYVSQMKKLGVDNVVSTYQTAYNRYLVWMKNNK